jgi:RNA polymerase sigma factor (TIGR02999 family)
MPPDDPPATTKSGVGEITLVLQKIERGDLQAADDLLPLVYEELRRLAAARMARESAAFTLQPTALVHEAWLRLGADRQPRWESRAHFFGAAAEAMRRILVDAARKRRAQRRGGAQPRIDIQNIDIPVEADDDRVLAVHDALERLGLEDPKKAQLVKLRYFAGLEVREAAQALGISEATAVRWWSYARAWIIANVSTSAR